MGLGGVRKRKLLFGGAPRSAAAGVPNDAAAGAAPTGAAATAAPFSVSMRATTVCTATVSPSCTRISASTPATGDGISASTLSVEISKIGSSRFSSSPTFFNHFDSVPSAIDSPIWGMMTSTRDTSRSSHSDLRVARAFRIRQMTIVGATMKPRIAPRTQKVSQLHGAPVCASGAHLLAQPTTFARSTAIIPNAIAPLTAVRQPTPR